MRKVLVIVGAMAACSASHAQFEAAVASIGGQYYSAEELYRRGKDSFTIGYVTAVFDADLTSRPLNGAYCKPQGVVNGQLVDVGFQYMERNPSTRHLHAAHILRESWRAAWPCPKQ